MVLERGRRLRVGQVVCADESGNKSDGAAKSGGHDVRWGTINTSSSSISSELCDVVAPIEEAPAGGTGGR